MRAGSYRQPFLFGILMFVNTARHGPFRVAVPLEREVLPGRLRHPGFDPAGASPSMPCTMVDDARIGQEPLTVMSEQKNELLTTSRKALTINLDEARYGTFAEIGAGQEVVRHFFQAGGASGTIAKTISAYDMVFSDAIYGKAPRYVSRERLSTMLDHEYLLLQERLAEARGSRTSFFVFADTVATRNFKGDNDAHGWMGIRFQVHPAGTAERHHSARPDVGQGGGAAAGGARDLRREFHLRGVLFPHVPREVHPFTGRQPQHRPHRGRHAEVHRPGVCIPAHAGGYGPLNWVVVLEELSGTWTIEVFDQLGEKINIASPDAPAFPIPGYPYNMDVDPVNYEVHSWATILPGGPKYAIVLKLTVG